MSKPVVAIVGRPNVGKSTLFNRLLQKRLAIEESAPGVTRDRLYSQAEWRGRQFWLVDTGGLTFEEDQIAREILHQVQVAIDEAHLIVMVVDVRSGLLPLDYSIAELLRKAGKPVLLAANKAEAPVETAEFFELGLGEPQAVSGAHGLGTGDLLDKIFAHLPAAEATAQDDGLRVAVIGRPNVGKSSLVNKLARAERVIVSDLPGTTRDAIDLIIEWDGRRYRIVDTAGIRRKSKIGERVEHYAVLRAIRAAEEADVVLVLLDAETGVTEQDKRIAGIAHEAGRALLIVVNKWDKVEKNEKTMDEFRRNIRRDLAYLSYAPILFVSALTGQRVQRVFAWADFVAEQHALRVGTAGLNELLAEVMAVTPPPAKGGRQLKIYYMTQVKVRPPTFAVFVNEPELMHFSYLRFLENRLRETYGFQGTPLRFLVRRRARKVAGM